MAGGVTRRAPPRACGYGYGGSGGGGGGGYPGGSYTEVEYHRGRKPSMSGSLIGSGPSTTVSLRRNRQFVTFGLLAKLPIAPPLTITRLSLNTQLTTEGLLLSLCIPPPLKAAALWRNVQLETTGLPALLKMLHSSPPALPSAGRPSPH